MHAGRSNECVSIGAMMRGDELIALRAGESENPRYYGSADKSTKMMLTNGFLTTSRTTQYQTF